MTTLPTTCITNSNQKLKTRKKNSTQLDAHGSSDKCCHYTKRNCVSTKLHLAK